MLNKGKIIAALRKTARELGRTPTRAEFRELSGISQHSLRQDFAHYGAALKAAKLRFHCGNRNVPKETLLADWGLVARKLGRPPMQREYDDEGRYTSNTFNRRFGAWSQVPYRFLDFVKASGSFEKWTDVVERIQRGPLPKKGGAWLKHKQTIRCQAPPTSELEKWQEQSKIAMLPPQLRGKRCITMTMLGLLFGSDEDRQKLRRPIQWSLFPEMEEAREKAEEENAPKPSLEENIRALFPRHVFKDRPMLGRPLGWPGLAYEPVNEMGVVLLFGMVAHRLGFMIECVQSRFPDCQAKFEVEPGRWQHVRIEFEFQSLEFRNHGHDQTQCDIIVCWRHNWTRCPEHIQVLELSRVVRMLMNTATSDWPLAIIRSPESRGILPQVTQTRRHSGAPSQRNRA